MKNAICSPLYIFNYIDKFGVCLGKQMGKFTGVCPHAWNLSKYRNLFVIFISSLFNIDTI